LSLNPLEQVNLIAMAAIAAVFLLTFATLRKAFFLPLISVMERRLATLERARTTDAETKALLERSHAEAERIVAEANADAERISKDREAELVRIREQRIAEAAAEAEGTIARGQEEVSLLTVHEQAKLKEQLLACSRQTLVKMIGDVDDAVLQFAVDRVLSAKKASE
jgi:F0F1-type ATP synthase membrane subunit b/b'